MENDYLGRRGRRLTRPGGGRIKAQGGDIVAAKAFSRKQAIFNEKASQYAGSGTITTPGYLRLESLAPFGSAVSQFSFNTLDTSGVKTATERRLKLADTFTITDLSFYIGNGPCTANAPTAAQYASQQLFTFPNSATSATTGITAAVATLLESIYNGFLTIRVDTTTFIDSLPMRQFYRVGTSQQGVGPAVVINRDEFPLSMYGKTELLPTIELNGQSNIEITVTLPNATVCSATTNANFINLVLIAQGFLNQGAAGTQRNLQRALR
jgi:hypothetical protein